MTLASVAAATPQKKPGSACSVGILLRTLDADDRAWLVSTLAADHQTVQHAWIARVLTADGHRATGQTIGRHRQAQCDCPT